MAATNIVFLIDVNAIPREAEDRKPTTVKSEGDGGNSTQNESMELIPREEDIADSSKRLEWLKLMTLLALYKEANHDGQYDFGRVQWSYKFYDSLRHVDYRDGRTFMPFDHDSFSNFENQVDLRMAKPRSTTVAETLEEDSYTPPGAGARYLSDAIKIITGNLPWSESQSLDHSRSFSEADSPAVKNMAVVFFKVPRTEEELLEFLGLQRASSTKEFMATLLPSTGFAARFHHQLKIQLNFVDFWTAPANRRLLDPPWNQQLYPRQILKCLDYLGSGKISAVPDFTVFKSGYNFGLIPYPQFLRLHLQNSSTQNENVPSHIKRLAPGVLRAAQKISPDFETSSVSRSLRSIPSVLENSINSMNQSKMLRPFRPSSGFVDDDDHLEFYRKKMAAIKAQDNCREGDRKRKRLNYDREDYYKGEKYVDDDDMEYDSVDTDSQCEKDQRLKSWVNEGNFENKRKKHLDTTTTSAVPMSRSSLNKSHVFHEPAPKLSGSRAKKMLATVERQKIKMTGSETRRRSSEGLDFKRIAQQQEKELSAIKRRLKTYIQGELDEDGDPIIWHRSFQKQLRGFAESVLQDANPCLVALAQALVNNASVKFTLQRMERMKKAYRNPNLTAKDLLEGMLLIDFPVLNKKIINAQETLDKTGSGSLTPKMRRTVAFRETELQIILRLEIAWCFVEPDEDATEEDLIGEIVRLLQIIGAYRIQPPIDHFVNTVLLPTYRQSSRFMRELYKRMSIPLPAQMAIDGSPLTGSKRDDDASMISSTFSANLYPEDSASQLQMNHNSKPKRHRQSPGMSNRNRSFGHYSGSRPARKVSSGSKKAKRQILLATSNHKVTASTSQYMMDRPDSQKKTAGAIPKASPKRVRRNLFDVQKHDKKDSKTLMNLASSSRLRSPAFKSPKSKSPMSAGSGFFRAARSRRQLNLSNPGSNHNFGSPSVHSDVLCPESPATPGDRLSNNSKNAATTPSGGSASKLQVIQESPELLKSEYENRPMAKVASLSFYSTGNDTSKSRAWERSETQLMAARIKDSVDLRSRENTGLGLSLSDFELLPRSPDPLEKVKPHDASGSTNDTSRTETNWSICYDSTEETSVKHQSQSPLIPNTESHSLHLLTGPAPNLNNPSIEALITSDKTFPLISKDLVSSMPPLQDPAHNSPSASATASPSNLETPSKRVQFNLNDNLVNTPARRSSVGTPKSILKELRETPDN